MKTPHENKKMLHSAALFVSFGAFILLALGIFICLPRATGTLLLPVLAAFAVFALLFWLAARFFPMEKIALWHLLLLGVLVKFSVVLLLRVEPVVDFLSFYDGAEKLAENTIAGSLRAERMAIFPHYFGYSALLSLIFRIFGASQAIPPLVNALASVIGIVFVRDLGQKIGGARAGVLAALIWIFFPSQTLYNLLCFGEPVYTVLMLAGFCLLVRGDEAAFAENWRKTAVYFGIFGGIWGIVGMFRPIVPILFVAGGIWLLFFRLGSRRAVLLRICGLAGAALLAAAFSAGTNAYLTARLGHDVATVPGFTVLVGLAEESGGRWNQADSTRLYSYIDGGLSPAQAQQKLLKDAKTRLFSGEIQNPVRHLARKFFNLWHGDAMAAEYAAKVLPSESAAKVVLNGYFYAMTLWAAAGAGLAVFRRERSVLAPLLLFAVGLTMAHLLVETAGRYHYAAAAVLPFGAAYALAAVQRKKEKT